MVPDAEERLSAACNALGAHLTENRSCCLKALALLLQQLQEASEQEASEPSAKDAAVSPAIDSAAAVDKQRKSLHEADTHTPEAAMTPQAERDEWLVEELLAARKALLSVKQEAPNVPVPLHFFESLENAAECKEEDGGWGGGVHCGEQEYDPDEI
ncbi:uncharacterized protein LOC34620386 [Cyclospora cayetanensis]|nr:uncharacterized protein LOC34620386 [Cyclospora cayetanensis]